MSNSGDKCRKLQKYVCLYAELAFGGGIQSREDRSEAKWRSPKRNSCFTSKGFLQNEVVGEVCVLERGSSGRSFWRSLGRSFWLSFGAYFAGTFRAKHFQQKLQPKLPTGLHSKTGENSGINEMMRFCRGTPPTVSLKEGMAFSERYSAGNPTGFAFQ